MLDDLALLSCEGGRHSRLLAEMIDLTDNWHTPGPQRNRRAGEHKLGIDSTQSAQTISTKCRPRVTSRHACLHTCSVGEGGDRARWTYAPRASWCHGLYEDVEIDGRCRLWWAASRDITGLHVVHVGYMRCGHRCDGDHCAVLPWSNAHPVRMHVCNVGPRRAGLTCPKRSRNMTSKVCVWREMALVRAPPLAAHLQWNPSRSTAQTTMPGA